MAESFPDDRVLAEAISINEVAEHRLSKWRLQFMTERDISGRRDRERLEKSEDRLLEAAQQYLRRGGSVKLAVKIIKFAEVLRR